MALALKPIPAPTSFSSVACSKRWASIPARVNASCAVKPPIPPPTNATQGFRDMSSIHRTFALSAGLVVTNQIDNRSHLRALFSDRGSKFGRRAAVDDQPNRSKPVGDNGVRRHGTNISGNAIPTLRSEIPCTKEARESFKRKVGIAGLLRGWDCRREWSPLRVDDCEQSYPPGLYLG